jgi:2-polyprenyl-6-methoxyphenol hydroxylase-like FAD-dependent oxidoreductase
MGLTSGILDADALAETLLMIFDKQQPISLLNTYSGERRKVFQTFVDPTTTHNKHRIQRTPESAYEDWFLQKFKNPAQTTLEEFLVPFMTTWRTDMAALAKN